MARSSAGLSPKSRPWSVHRSPAVTRSAPRRSRSAAGSKPAASSYSRAASAKRSRAASILACPRTSAASSRCWSASTRAAAMRLACTRRRASSSLARARSWSGAPCKAASAASRRACTSGSLTRNCRISCCRRTCSSAIWAKRSPSFWESIGCSPRIARKRATASTENWPLLGTMPPRTLSNLVRSAGDADKASRISSRICSGAQPQKTLVTLFCWLPRMTLEQVASVRSPRSWAGAGHGASVPARSRASVAARAITGWTRSPARRGSPPCGCWSGCRCSRCCSAP